MGPQPGPSTTSASAIDVQKYTGTCLISHKARSRKQKPSTNNACSSSETNKNNNTECNCNCKNFSPPCSPPTSPGVNLAWAGLPLISLATTAKNSKLKSHQKVKNTLALHAKGIPLILSPSSNYGGYQYLDDHQVHAQLPRGWHWPPPPPPHHHPHHPPMHAHGHAHQQTQQTVVSHWQYAQRFAAGHGMVTTFVENGVGRSPQRTASSVSSGSCSSSISGSDSMSVTSEESASGGRGGVDVGNGAVVPRVLKARKRRKKDCGKGKVSTKVDDEGPAGLVTLQPYMPLCYGFTGDADAEADDEHHEVVVESERRGGRCKEVVVRYPNPPSPLCTCRRCVPCPSRRRTSTSTSGSSSASASASGEEVGIFPTPPSTPLSGCEADVEGRFWSPDEEEEEEDEEDQDELCASWDTMATGVSNDSFKFPLNISSPPSRPWITVAQPAKSQPTCIFTVMCYNVLCDKYATRQMYGYCPNWALSWDYRRKAILDEIRHYNADIITLQEVETDQFYNFFMPELTRDGYDGIFSPKSRAKTMSESDRKFVDGCAIFFRMSKFKLMKKHLAEFTQLAMANAEGSDDMLNRVMTKDNIGLCALLETKEGAWENGLPGDGSSVRQPLLVCTAHIHWDPECCDVKLIQTMMLMNELRAIAEDSARSFRPGIHKPEPNAIPLILCGDFNSLPESGVIEFLSSGHISADHPDFKELGYKSCLQKLSSSERPNEYMHSFRLSRSYGNDVMPYTNYTFDFKGIIDYILFSKQFMAPLGILGPLDPLWLKEHKVVGCPHPHIPSDHFPLLVELEMLPQPQALSNISNGLILRR